MSVTPAEIIQRRRAALGLTQDQLAERIGRTASTVRRWERGDATPPESLIPTLARALQVSPRDLAVAFGADAPEPAPSGSARPTAPTAAPAVPPRQSPAETTPREAATPDPNAAPRVAPAAAPPAPTAAPGSAGAPAPAAPDMAASDLPIDEQATVAAPAAVAPAAAATVAAPPQQPKRRSPLRRAPALDASGGLTYLEDSRQRLRYWLRAALTIVAIIILLMILIWAFGEFWDALGKVWDLFGDDTTPVTTPGAEF